MMETAAQIFIDDVKAKFCSEIIRRQDFSLRQIGELAFLLGLEAGIDMTKSANTEGDGHE